MTQLTKRLKVLEQQAKAAAGGNGFESLSIIELKYDLARLLAGLPRKHKIIWPPSHQSREAELRRMTDEELKAQTEELSKKLIKDEEFQAAYVELTGKRYTG